MGWTILNIIGLAIGAYCSKLVLEELQKGKLVVALSILITISFGCIKFTYLGLAFGIISIITTILASMFLTFKDGTKAMTGEECQRAWNAQQAAKARANPTLAMLDTINMSIRNNSPSVPFFGGQQCDQYGTQSRIKTELDIQSGRAENGTNGVWLKD